MVLNFNMLDVLVFGGVVKVVQGEMMVMVFGSEVVFICLKFVLDVVVSNVYCISDMLGVGLIVKIIYQLLVGVYIVVVVEVMVLVVWVGIFLDVMYDVVIYVVGNFWMFENCMQYVVDGDYILCLVVDIFVKDLGLVVDMVKVLCFFLLLVFMVLNMFISVSNVGYGKEDDSVVIKIFLGIILSGVMFEELLC